MLLIFTLLAFPSVAEAHPCGHTTGFVKREIKRTFTSPKPISRARYREIRQMLKCPKRTRDVASLRRYRHRYGLWRKRNTDKLLFQRLPRRWQRWARNITACESGWRRYVVNSSGHRSYFQWNVRTWHAAGGKGLPESSNWYRQARIAIRWAWKAGTSQWVCKG